MKILADLHISPKTVLFLRNMGHDAVRVNEIMPPTSADKKIVETAINSNRVVLTQDLDFSEIIALSGKSQPSLISLRMSKHKCSAFMRISLGSFFSSFKNVFL